MYDGHQLRLLILGASVRAAAQSASRTGCKVIAADQFADRDFRAICPEANAAIYPQGLVEFAMNAPESTWMYTGAMENYPELVEQISKRHRLLGNGEEVVRKVRDPEQLSRFACFNGYYFPDTHRSEPSPWKRWLIKRMASGGGLGIRHADGSTHLKDGEVFQEWIDGVCGSAAFIAVRDEDVRLLYAAEQLPDAPFLGAPAFHYAGSVTTRVWDATGPLGQATLHRLGIDLKHHFGLRGLFGVDFIVREGKIWLLEINPRYTASMELFERMYEDSLIELQIQTSLSTWPPIFREGFRPQAGRRCYQAKGILYAQGDCHITDRMSDRLWAMRGELDLADLPMGGGSIGKGHPVLTIFAEGDSREETMASLEEKANQLRALGIP